TIIHNITASIMQHNPTGTILVATNPVDVLSYAVWKCSGLPSAKVIGSGTILDTARFRYMLSEYFNVDARSVHAYVIGEHGDSEVPVWSLANIAGMHLPTFCDQNGLGCTQDDLDRIFQQTRDAAYNIITLKGATYYAIASGLVRIVEGILRDESTVLSVSSLITDYYGISNVYLSLPAIVHKGGVERVLHLELAPLEIQGVQNSARILKQYLDQINFG
ncbi:MAG: L-lactate dehydrogenase, partial [Anaerolineaceae bacterium]|nr:L-lactate dehydrogenase [Anaerolineaceae bacterium]